MNIVKTKLGTSLAISFLILLISSGLALWSISIQMRSADNRDEENKRALLLEQLYSTVKEAESDQREYLVLGSESIFAMERSKKNALDYIDKFTSGCSKEMIPLADSLRTLVVNRYEHLFATAKLPGKSDTASFTRSFEEGRLVMAQFSSLLHRMENMLRDSIIAQDNAAGRIAFYSHIIIIASLVAAFILLVGAFRRTSRAFALRLEAEQMLKQSEHFRQTITDIVPGLIAVYNINTGKYLFVNDAIQQVLGYDKSEVFKKGVPFFMSIIHPDDVTTLMQKNAEALQRANTEPGWSDLEAVNFEYRMKHKNGQWRWFLTSGLVFRRSPEGKVEELINLSFDITDNKQYENDLEQSEAKFRTLFEKSRDAVMLVSNMEFVDCNSAAIELFNAPSKQSLIHTSPHKISPAKQPNGERSEDEARKMAAIAMEKGWHRFEWVHKKFTGEEFWVEVSLTALTLDDEKVLHAMVRDISERKRAQELLVKSEEMLQEAQKMANLGSWEWDITNNTVTWSDELYRMYGYEPGSISLNYETFLDHVHPEDVDKVKSIIENSYAAREPYTFEHRVVQPDGRIRILLGKGRVVPDAEGKVIKMLGSTLDITDIKNTREELRQKDEFIGIASHELKTPLTSIKAYTQLLEESLVSNGTDLQLAYIKKTGVHIDRLNCLISDLLDVSKIQAGKLQFNISRFNIDELLKESIESIQYTSATHTIVKQGSADLVIKGDRLRLEQAFVNLLTNAIKYSPAASEVIVNITEEQGRVKVSVKDFGIGIPNEKLSRVFDRFYRVENTPHKFTGLGIGLYITKEIIHRHEGSLWVESAPGSGSTFHFSLPCN